MAARVINLVVDQGVDFEATFTIQNQNASALNLTGYTAEAKMRKHPVTKYYPFVISFPNRLQDSAKFPLRPRLHLQLRVEDMYMILF